jgi:hypothetical protein
MSDIENIISDLRKKYEQSYGFAVFELDLVESKDTIMIRGQVLTKKQKEEVIAGIKNVCRKKIEDDIGVLSDINSQEIGWAVVRADVADLKSRFISTAAINEKILRRIRVSQASKGEILRVLLQKEDQVLVQSDDLTLGWVNLADADLQQVSMRERWRHGIVADSDALIPVDFSEENFIKAAEKFLGAKYILGAKSDTAIDCSGFTQMVYKNMFDIILPKHSWDQKRVGVAVDMSEAETGDLIFMTNKEKGTKHVGIWEETREGGNIIHASCADRKVVRQKVEEVFMKYTVVEVRRIVKR